MHAGFPCLTPSLHQVMHLGAKQANLIDVVGGPLLAAGMALLLKLGFGYVMRDSLLDKARAEKAQAFFNENLVFIDPNAPGGQRFYQGQFLFRTRKAGDNMNVWLRFCPNPDEIFIDTPFGRTINSLAIVTTEVLTENDAEKLERDIDKVDLVVRFKDIDSIVALIGRDSVDMVGLLLENVVQLTGNVGHLFKLGAIARNIEEELGLTQSANN